MLSAAGQAGSTVKDRSESGGPKAFNPSRHIGNATFAKDPCETLVAVSGVISHRSKTKTPDPFSFRAFSRTPIH
jgi:hypothetical protein